MSRKTRDQISQTRKETLHAVWIKVVEELDRLALVPKLNATTVEKVVEDYIATRGAYVARYKIKDRIQRHKIAGLMAASILKFKPVEMNDRDHSPVYESTQGNEILAFWHSLAICAEGAELKSIEELCSRPNFEVWKGDLLCLFEQHPGSAEAFSLIFETMSLSFFQSNLDRTKELSKG